MNTAPLLFGHDVKEFLIPIYVTVQVGDKAATDQGDLLLPRFRRSGTWPLLLPYVFIHSLTIPRTTSRNWDTFRESDAVLPQAPSILDYRARTR